MKSLCPSIFYTESLNALSYDFTVATHCEMPGEQSNNELNFRVVLGNLPSL